MIKKNLFFISSVTGFIIFYHNDNVMNKIKIGYDSSNKPKFSQFFPELMIVAKAKSNYDQLLYDFKLEKNKEKEKLLNDIKDLKRKILMIRMRDETKTKKLKKSLIELYSEVLDELEGFDYNYKTKDQLPRVVVVGEQSAGKTSVLEMVAQARLFPRGAGSMMTRAPVKVTLADGPYSIARFEGEEYEYDLSTKEGEAALRKEIEARMDAAARGKTISKTPVSLSVRGPGLKRMVLVDLPGVINTVTTGMHSGAKDAVRELAIQYMGNPNAIILCIQDGSKDAETSSIVDLVASMDPQGKRTIFVLTKIDLAMSQMSNPSRIRDILSGKVFKMNALGYFAVIAGRGNKEESIQEIKKYEHEFFENSQLVNNGVYQPNQVTTENLSVAVSSRFWKMVEESVEQQCDVFRALRFNLETEWKHKFAGYREQDRLELFEKARNEILDNILVFNDITNKKWEDLIQKKLWDQIENDFYDNILIPCDQLPTTDGLYQATVDIKLKNWVDNELPQQAIKVGSQLFMDQLKRIEKDGEKKSQDSELFKPLKDAVYTETFKNYSWDEKAQKALRVVQFESLNNTTVKSKSEWAASVSLLKNSLDNQLKKVDSCLDHLKGPGTMSSWLLWKSKSPIQRKRCAVVELLEEVLKNNPSHHILLESDEVSAVKRNLQLKKIDVNAEFIEATWNVMYRRHFFQTAMKKANDCSKRYFHSAYNDKNISTECRDVLLFWRLLKMLEATTSSLMMQISNNENRRLERILKSELDKILIDDTRLYDLISGSRVKLAEDLKHVRRIQEKLEQFICALKSQSR